jgi:hypothetical protein
MNAIGFLALAKELLAGPSDAHCRTAVSRAYYGAFHLACQLVSDCGVKLPRSAAAHEKATQCMQSSKNSDVALAGVKLHSLRRARNSADYSLEDREFDTAKRREHSLPLLMK